MSTTDPRILIPMLEELQLGLQRGNMECRNTIADADRTQRHLAEHRTRLATRVHTLEALTDEDERHVRQTLHAVESAEARGHDAAVRTDQVLSHSHRVYQAAERTRAYWRSEVERATRRVAVARAWVARAEAAVEAAACRVNRAIAELEAAIRRVESAAQHVIECENRVAQAEYWLASAQAELAACRSSPVTSVDGQGRVHYHPRDCSSCEAAVQSARRELSNAHSALGSAQSELNFARRQRAEAERELADAQSELAAARADLANARAELAAAEQDLRICQSNLAKAEQAVRCATAAVQQAEIALATAAAALDAAAASRVPTERAGALNVLQKERCNQLDALARQAESSLHQGEGEVRQARSHGDTAADTVRACNNDLSLRVDHLQALERPHVFAS